MRHLALISTHQVVFRQAFFAAVLLAAPVAAFAQEDVAPAEASATESSPVAVAPVQRRESFHEYLDDTVKSPYSYGYSFAGAVLDQWTDFPGEWNGASGFARRTAARVGQGIVADAMAHGTAAMLNQRITYDPCRCSGAGARTKHALLRAFVAARNDGKPAPNWPLWISKYSSSGFANAWYPESYTRRDVLIQASSAVAISAGLNVLREFAHFK